MCSFLHLTVSHIQLKLDLSLKYKSPLEFIEEPSNSRVNKSSLFVQVLQLHLTKDESQRK